ncbi:MAG TPA: hypothetical protein VFG87_18275 [Amycolatopsis sp.]|jgi:hypothetical protein|nr:hypothetical protein [Amycolatopsis sp.]
MAKGGSGRPGGKPRSSGKGSAGRGAGSRRPSRNSTAAQRAIRGARGGNRLAKVILPAVVVIVAVVVVVGVVVSRGGSNSASPGAGLPPGADTSTALLANTASQATGDTVDGVASNDMEQVLFHIHAHLAIYINGTQKLIPYGVGIVPPYQLQDTADGPFVAGGSKYYWLHTHDETGVIHVESPVQHTYTVGEFFDVWHQPLSGTQIGPDTGTVTAFLNGQKYTGDPRNIPLDAHNVIQLDLGTVVPFADYTFPQGL